MKIGDFAHFFIKTFVVVTHNINGFAELTKKSFKCHETLPALVFFSSTFTGRTTSSFSQEARFTR